jgi:hypothetical protein
VDAVDSSTSQPNRLPLGNELDVHWIAVRANPEPAGTFLEKRKVICLYRESKNLSSNAKYSQYTDWEILAPSISSSLRQWRLEYSDISHRNDAKPR